MRIKFSKNIDDKQNRVSIHIDKLVISLNLDRIINIQRYIIKQIFKASANLFCKFTTSIQF